MNAAPAKARVDSIDLVRGLVMVIMVLDHVRDYVHSGFFNDPTDLTKTTPALFLTRFITHYCAPVFVFLAGTSAFLTGARGRTRGDLARFLVTRGIWLVILEVTLVRLGSMFNADLSFLGILQVIWALGLSMIVLAALVFLPVWLVGTFGVAMVALHNLLDGIQVPFGPTDLSQTLWKILHQQGLWQIGDSTAFIAYPLVPWVGVMAAGYAFGTIFQWESARRRRVLFALGAAMIAAFVVLRVPNLYGDPEPWSAQPRGPVFTALSFIKVTKYPPSLQYLLVTLGPAILLLAALEGRRIGAVGRQLVMFGRVPLFFYLLQWPLAHLSGVVLVAATGGDTARFFVTPDSPAFQGPGPNLGLAAVYGAWLVAIAILYPLCRWFAGVKARRRDWWLSYL